MMKDMNKYFSGEYMKYWYVAFVVVLAAMFFSFYNSKSVYQFEVTVFDQNANVIERKIIHERELGLVETIRAPKAVKPIKKF